MSAISGKRRNCSIWCEPRKSSPFRGRQCRWHRPMRRWSICRRADWLDARCSRRKFNFGAKYINTQGNSMSANNALHIAVLSGDGIGPEVMVPALEVLRKIEATSDLKFRFSDAPAGANNYLATGKSMPESTVRLCDEAAAILLGACGLPSVRYPDNTEIMPQVELRFHFDLYAGVRPARLIPGVPSPIVGADQRGIDLVVIRESTEELIDLMGKGIVTDSEARETLVITRKASERLFEFSVRLAERRKARGRQGALAWVAKATVFKAFA